MKKWLYRARGQFILSDAVSIFLASGSVPVRAPRESSSEATFVCYSRARTDWWSRITFGAGARRSGPDAISRAMITPLMARLTMQPNTRPVDPFTAGQMSKRKERLLWTFTINSESRPSWVVSLMKAQPSSRVIHHTTSPGNIFFAVHHFHSLFGSRRWDCAARACESLLMCQDLSVGTSEVNERVGLKRRAEKW